MPSHIDVLCGDYRGLGDRRITSAVRADRKFVERYGPLNFYSLYRAHDLHFVVYSAMFEGRFQPALDAAAELAGQLTPELLAIDSPPMADWLEAFVPLRVHVLVRFGAVGRADRHAAARGPRPLLHAPPRPSTTGAASRTPRRASSRRRTPNGTRWSPRLRAHPRLPLPVQQHQPRHPGDRRGDARRRDRLPGRHDSRKRSTHLRSGHRTRRHAALRRAMGLDAADPACLRRAAARAGPRRGGRRRYTPPTWGSTPPCGGPASTPDNVWSLHGYHECLRRLGRDAEAEVIAQQLDLARARADVPILASCACRLEVTNQPTQAIRN